MWQSSCNDYGKGLEQCPKHHCEWSQNMQCSVCKSLERGKVLLFPNLQASHSKEAESTGLFINPDWNKVDIIEAFGWPSLLCHKRELF